MKKKLMIFILVTFIFLNFVQTQSVLGNKAIFKVTVNCDVPAGETVCMLAFFDSSSYFIPGEKIADNEWQFDVGKYFTPKLNYSIQYFYCRNSSDSIEEFSKVGQIQREIQFTKRNMEINDTVNKWTWWNKDGKVPEIVTDGHLNQSPAYLPRNDLMCGIAFPDWYVQNTETVAFEDSLNKIVERTNANHVHYFQLPIMTQYSPKPIIEIVHGKSGTNNESLINLIQAAHKRGLEFHLMLTIPYEEGKALDPTDAGGDAWWKEYKNQLIKVMGDQAKLAEDNNVEVLIITFISSYDQVTINNETYFNNMYKDVIKAIKNIYKGKLGYATNHETEFRAPFYDFYPEFDYFFVGYWPGIQSKLCDSTNPTVTEMVNNLNNYLENDLKKLYDQWKIPLIMQPAAPSFNGAALSEEFWENHHWWMEDDPDFPLDLQEQADMYEAYFQTMSSKEWIHMISCFQYNYWDSIDKTPSVRGKPAEQVIAKWFKWINAGPSFQILNTNQFLQEN